MNISKSIVLAAACTAVFVFSVAAHVTFFSSISEVVNQEMLYEIIKESVSHISSEREDYSLLEDVYFKTRQIIYAKHFNNLGNYEIEAASSGDKEELEEASMATKAANKLYYNILIIVKKHFSDTTNVRLAYETFKRSILSAIVNSGRKDVFLTKLNFILLGVDDYANSFLKRREAENPNLPGVYMSIFKELRDELKRAH